MIHRNLRYIAGWEWHVLQLKHIPVSVARRKHLNTQAVQASLHDADELYINEKRELIQSYPEATKWINDSYDRFTNNIILQKIDGYGMVVQGTVLIKLSEDENDVSPFHFWLAKNKLIVMQRDIRIPLRLQQLSMLDEYEQCQHAPEAFFIMITSLLDSLHMGLDRFEDRLGELEKDMKERNRKDLLDIIIERRYELLHFSHLFLPIRELEGLAKEAFLDELIHSDGFQRVQYRFQRIDSLLKHYAIEIDTLISVDDALSNFRGNDIVRTLTIFTSICLPASIIGAIWGTNFTKLPFQHEPFGFLYMLGAILLVTGSIYLLFWRKGWTGDILSKKKVPPIEKLQELLLKHPEPQSTSSELPSRKLRGKKLKAPAAQHVQEKIADDDAPLPSRKRK